MFSFKQDITLFYTLKDIFSTGKYNFMKNTFLPWEQNGLESYVNFHVHQTLIYQSNIYLENLKRAIFSLKHTFICFCMTSNKNFIFGIILVKISFF